MKNQLMHSAKAMNQRAMKGLVLVLLSAFAASPSLAYESGSTGADGEFNPTESQTVQLPPNGIFNYTQVNIPAGVTITYQKNAANTPVTLLVSGDATIAGTLNVSGMPPLDANDIGAPGLGGPGGFDGGRGGSPGGDAKDWLDGYVGNTIGQMGKGPGGGFPGKIVKSRTTIIAGGGGSYGDSAQLTTGDPECITVPGSVYGNMNLLPLLGGSGGGGGVGGSALPGTGGGGGGGAILLAASGTINITGAILANGAGSRTHNGYEYGSLGGSGSGGAIRLVATAIKGNGAISAVGARVNRYYSYQTSGSGSGSGSGTRYLECSDYRYNLDTSYGGSGRIRLEYETLSRSVTTTPPYTGSAPNVLTLPNLPALNIVSVGGVAVPATPTGSGDVALPKGTANPVEVVFSTRGITVGSSITLTVIPASGLPITATSEPTTGVSENATASVSIDLPARQSVMQASVTYTVVAAVGDAMSVFAQGERVEKVRLSASLGGASLATLITVSGQEYEVPVAALAALPG